MGMYSYVYGIKPADEKFKKMLDIYKLCQESDVEIPDEVDDFFDGEPPDEKGVHIDLKDITKPCGGDMEEGFEVDITDLPKDVKIIRFINSY